MSLRKSLWHMPALLAAVRHNAQFSTRPLSAVKQNSKLNAIKPSRDALPENFAWPVCAGWCRAKTRENFQSPQTGTRDSRREERSFRIVSKTNEQCGNVYENKGARSHYKRAWRSEVTRIDLR